MPCPPAACPCFCYCRRWATSKVPDAHYMNVGSGAQVQQLLFAGVDNKLTDKEPLPLERVFKVGRGLAWVAGCLAWVGRWLDGGWAVCSGPGCDA